MPTRFSPWSAGCGWRSCAPLCGAISDTDVPGARRRFPPPVTLRWADTNARPGQQPGVLGRHHSGVSGAATGAGHRGGTRPRWRRSRQPAVSGSTRKTRPELRGGRPISSGDRTGPLPSSAPAALAARPTGWCTLFAKPVDALPTRDSLPTNWCVPVTSFVTATQRWRTCGWIRRWRLPRVASGPSRPPRSRSAS